MQGYKRKVSRDLTLGIQSPRHSHQIRYSRDQLLETVRVYSDIVITLKMPNCYLSWNYTLRSTNLVPPTTIVHVFTASTESHTH
jgi:hypothetical protein